MVHNKFHKQQRWLLFLLHARNCKPPCADENCVTVQALLTHMDGCVEPHCLYPRCCRTKSFIRHYENCNDLRCPVCVQVKTYRQQQANARESNDSVLRHSDGPGSGAPHCDDNLKLGEDMRTPVFSELQKQNPCPADDASKAAKYLDVTRNLEEESLYQMANDTKEDCINPTSTLESRLSSLTKRRKLNDHNQIQQNANFSPPGTIITPAPEVSSETTTMEVKKVPENGDQLEKEMAEILMSMSVCR